MKKILTLITITTILFSACKKDNNTPEFDEKNLMMLYYRHFDRSAVPYLGREIFELCRLISKDFSATVEMTNYHTIIHLWHKTLQTT